MLTGLVALFAIQSGRKVKCESQQARHLDLSSAGIIILSEAPRSLFPDPTTWSDNDVLSRAITPPAEQIAAEQDNPARAKAASKSGPGWFCQRLIFWAPKRFKRVTIQLVLNAGLSKVKYE